MNYENYGKLYTSIHMSKHCWHENLTWNLILQLVAEPKIKVRKLDGNLLVRTIAMTLGMKLDFCKIKPFHPNDFKANLKFNYYKIFMPYSNAAQKPAY